MVGVRFFISEGIRIFFKSWKSRLKIKEYDGNATEICKQIVDECWNNRYLQTSTSNFSQFWTRDFGWCVSSLIKLKQEKRVHATIRYALNRFKKYRQITTTITPRGRPFNFPNYAVDSLPWFIHSIRKAKFEYYEHRNFLNWQIKQFYKKVIDPETGLVKKNKKFSSIKDFSIRHSSCYDNCMVAMLAKDLSKMKYLNNPFKNYNYPALLKKYFWNGKFFYDDLTKNNYVAGDANIFPFILGIISNKEMIKSVINEIRKNYLDYPLPLKYTFDRNKIKFIWEELFLKDYESNSIWTHMGPLYIKMVQQVDLKLANEYKKKYQQMIKKHKNYLEVFDFKGKPFSTPFYYCDSGMLWAANYLTL